MTWTYFGKAGSYIDLVDQGPIVEVAIVPHLARPGQPVPRFTERLLLDTGASATSVEPRVTQGLGIGPSDTIRMVGFNMQEEECPVFYVNLEMRVRDGSGAQATIQQPTLVAQSPRSFRPAYGCAGLLGRDFLKLVRVTYDGPAGEFELELLHSQLRS